HLRARPARPAGGRAARRGGGVLHPLAASARMDRHCGRRRAPRDARPRLASPAAASTPGGASGHGGDRRASGAASRMISATVVICTHNRATVVRAAIEHALVEARRCAADVLVVDNASTDDTAAVVADAARGALEVRVVREEQLGLSAARNRGLADARGDVVAYLDDDATPRPGWLAALLAHYDDARVACVGGRIVLRFASAPPPSLTPALPP